MKSKAVNGQSKESLKKDAPCTSSGERQQELGTLSALMTQNEQCPTCGKDRAARITVRQRRVLIALLGDEPMSIDDVAKTIHCSNEAARDVINWWREQGVVRVAAWRRKVNYGPFVQLFLAQAGEDAPKPERMTGAEACQRWRSRQPKAKVVVNTAPRIGVWGL